MTTVNIGNNTGDTGGIQDTRLDSGAAQHTMNYGAATGTIVGKQDASRDERSLLRFDLSSIGVGNACSAAVLYLYDPNWVNRTADCTIDVFKVADANGNWVEGTNDGSVSDGEPSWSYKANYTPTPIEWAGSAGLSTAGTDYVNTSLGQAVFTDGVGGYRTITLNASGRAVVQSWFGGTGGNGILLIGTGSDGCWTSLVSRQGADGQRPYLVVTYAPTGGIGLAGLGSGMSGGFRELSGGMT
jgi:hypothetical protein